MLKGFAVVQERSRGFVEMHEADSQGVFEGRELE
jgi:hypothetical protein